MKKIALILAIVLMTVGLASCKSSGIDKATQNKIEAANFPIELVPEGISAEFVEMEGENNGSVEFFTNKKSFEELKEYYLKVIETLGIKETANMDTKEMVEFGFYPAENADVGYDVWYFTGTLTKGDVDKEMFVQIYESNFQGSEYVEGVAGLYDPIDYSQLIGEGVEIVDENGNVIDGSDIELVPSNEIEMVNEGEGSDQSVADDISEEASK